MTSSSTSTFSDPEPGGEFDVKHKRIVLTNKDGKEIGVLKVNKKAMYSCRIAELKDIKEIESFVNDKSEKMFGTYCLQHLIECSLHPIVLINKSDDAVVAFMTVKDYPNPPFLPTSGWENWFIHMYMVEFSPVTTRFLSFLAWDEKRLKGTYFLKRLCQEMFAADPYVEFLLYISPLKETLGPPFDGVFEHYLTRRDLDKEPMSVRGMRLQKEKYLYDLYVVYRTDIGPNLNPVTKIRKKWHYNGLQMTMEKNKLDMDYFKDLITNKAFVGILGETRSGKKKQKEFGVMFVTKDVNLESLDQHFDTFPYYGFRMSEASDNWFEVAMRRRALFEYRQELESQLSPTYSIFDGHYSSMNKSSLDCRKYHDFINIQSAIAKEIEESSDEEEVQPREHLGPGNITITKEIGMSTAPYAFLNISQEKQLCLGATGKKLCPKLRKANVKKPEDFVLPFIRDTNYSREFPSVKLSDFMDEVGMTKHKPFLQDQSTQTTKVYVPDEVAKMFDYLYIDKKDLWERVYENKCPDGTDLLEVKYYGESLALSVEAFFPSNFEDTLCRINYIKKAFEVFPNQSFCLIGRPRNSSIECTDNLLHYFKMVEPKRGIENEQEFDLYVCHKSAINGRFVVRETFMSDFERLLAVSRSDLRNEPMLYDLLQILIEKTSGAHPLLTELNERPDPMEKSFRESNSEMRAFTLVAGELLVGYAVVCSHNRMQHLQRNYAIEEYMKPSAHRPDCHGLVKHLCISKLFGHLTRFFLRGIMRICDWTTMVTFTMPKRKLKKYMRYSIPQGLEYWSQVRPRVQPQFPKTLGDLRPHVMESPHRGLHLLTYKMTGRQKTMSRCRLVIVGSGDLAISFLEHILFSPWNESTAFRHVTIITEGSLPTKYSGSLGKLVKTMIPDFSGRYDQEHLDKCCLNYWVDVVKGNMTGIDRSKKTVLVDESYDVPYDYLFLLCGMQFFHPFTIKQSLNTNINELWHSKTFNLHCKETLKLFMNVFTINSCLDALKSLKILPHLLNQSRSDAQAVVYGNCVDALSCVAALLDYGLYGDRITLVITPDEELKSTTYINNQEIKESVVNTMEAKFVTVLSNYKLQSWDEEETEDGILISYVHLHKDTNLVIVPVSVFFSYHHQKISPETYKACSSSGLSFDEKLVIFPNFRTSDDYIYSAGSMTTYSPREKLISYNHEYYNPVEIGAEMADVFIKRLKGVEETEHWPGFSQPLVVHAQLPGGWNYAKITKPGNEIVSNCKDPSKGVFLQTGSVTNEDGPGFFRIMIDEFGIIRELLCYTHHGMEVKNLVNIYGKHESLLNNLLYKFEGQQIADLFAYFREPWAYALYHDQFAKLHTQIQQLFLKNLFKAKVDGIGEASFKDVVHHMDSGLIEMSDLYRELLEDIFNSEFKTTIEDKVLEFLSNFRNDLPFYKTDDTDVVSEKMKVSSLMLNRSVLLGTKPFIDCRPKHVVKTIQRRHEMEDRPLDESNKQIDFRTNLILLDDSSEEKNKSETNKNNNDQLSRDLTRDSESGTCKSSDSSLDPYLSGVDSDKEIKITVRPQKIRKNISYLNIPLEKIDCDNAVEKRFEEYKKSVVEKKGIKKKLLK